MRDVIQRMVCEWMGIEFPYAKLGNIDTLDYLVNINEFAIFDLYRRNCGRYQKVLDIGANRGLHSIMMAKCGWEVKAFEPDPEHFKPLSQNVAPYPFVEASCVAVSTQDGVVDFVRVLGNTTGNHIAGCKNPYGAIETLKVPTVDCRPLFKWADFAKIDCEGHEAALLCTVTDEKTDFIVEVGNEQNAMDILRHFMMLGRPMYSQKTGWGRVQNFADMPTHHSQGSLFIGDCH